jgi:hypothetical protein
VESLRKSLVGVQLSPPGMHMLHLCFTDDIRTPEVDKNLVGTSFPEPSQDGYVGMYENPLLQRYYQVCGRP